MDMNMERFHSSNNIRINIHIFLLFDMKYIEIIYFDVWADNWEYC